MPVYFMQGRGTASYHADFMAMMVGFRVSPASALVRGMWECGLVGIFCALTCEDILHPDSHVYGTWLRDVVY